MSDVILAVVCNEACTSGVCKMLCCVVLLMVDCDDCVVHVFGVDDDCVVHVFGVDDDCVVHVFGIDDVDCVEHTGNMAHESSKASRLLFPFLSRDLGIGFLSLKLLSNDIMSSINFLRRGLVMLFFLITRIFLPSVSFISLQRLNSSDLNIFELSIGV